MDAAGERVGAEFGLRVFADAKVHLNGELIEGAPGRRARRRALQQAEAADAGLAPLAPLLHGDRIILGPCRFVAIFLAFDPAAVGEDGEDARQRALAGAASAGPGGGLWEYSAVVAEMMQRVGRVPRLFGSTDSSAEGRLWEELLRGLELANQANEIAAEMAVNVEFCVTMTTTLPPHFDETQMHELPSLGAHVVIHCRTALPDKGRRSSASPASPSSPTGTPSSSFDGEKVGQWPPKAERLARVQSRESDVDFLPVDCSCGSLQGRTRAMARINYPRVPRVSSAPRECRCSGCSTCRWTRSRTCWRAYTTSTPPPRSSAGPSGTTTSPTTRRR